ncbi:helix-turn-helix transcriptional regulator [Streptacidiphilus jiangxiensis]|uniref:Helix-turn-helix domain-containing protein n=1 Tax=Streptacidiphilus jiangxiensis TaxID=235985 RepID=A0A1H7JPP5_STRJI|nr:helix-turn-helix transcriptional regulator [Streptacidiphilus jiangxiensis]SEK75435.1 Helix-turn-helix domain-containing protein [Streptacidiphilus jiangxiensis]
MEASRRKELGDFLRRSRERRTPAEAGLSAGSRRRTPGLRRQEVADLAGVSPTWYTWLEQGREVTPSVRTLEAIGDALGLSRAEREHMFRLAAVLPKLEGDSSENLAVPDAVRRIVHRMDPFPACVYNLTYDLLVFNRAYGACFPGLAARRPEERNFLRYFASLGDAELAAQEPLISGMIRRFRANYSANLDNPRWRELVDAVILTNPRMREHWERHAVLDASDHSHDETDTPVGRIGFTSTALVVSATPGLNILVGVPRTDDDQDLLLGLVPGSTPPAAGH